MDSVRFGVVGTGSYAERRHLLSLKTHPRVELAAICGRDPQRAEEMARKHTIPHVFADYRDMLDRARLDALVVAAPDDLHHPITLAALEAGLHVICEKPLAMSADQAAEMYRRAEAAGVAHMTFFTNRWVPAYRYAHDLVAAGYLGRAVHADLRFIGGYARRSDDPAWWRRFHWRAEPGRSNGVLAEIGSHAVDRVRWFLGEIASVSAQLASTYQATAPDGRPFSIANDTAALTLRLRSGAVATITATATAVVADRGTGTWQQDIFLGDDGTLEIEHSAVGSALRGARSGDPTIHPLPIPEDRFRLADLETLFRSESLGDRYFVDALLAGRPVTPSFYDGWKAQQIVDAALRSSATGRVVDL